MNKTLIGNENNIIFYEDENGNSKVEVVLNDENVWLNTNAIANLFNVQRPAIVKHINNIYNDEELDKNSTCSILEQVQLEGNRKVSRKKDYYNLDMIISIGFRVNSKKATEFRIWATNVLKEYIIKGFSLNDERFINGNKYDTKYFDELLERIKVIRTKVYFFISKLYM